MPKSQSPSTNSPNKPPSPFVNYDLSADDKKQLAKLNPTWEDLGKEVTLLVKEGYKLTIGWDNYSDALAVWLIGQKTTVNEGLILPSRANDLRKAIASVIYKHKAVFSGVWHNRTLTGQASDDF
jgi:hypothetical protein